MIKQPKQAESATTGVVAVEPAWSGTGALAFTAPRTFSHRPAIGYTNPMIDGTDVTNALGTRAWSPPV